MTTAPVTQIPVEIYGVIIEILRKSLDLINCSLVCRSWAPFTRRQLFSRVVLNGKSALRFVKLLQSPHCTITPSRIRSVTLSSLYPDRLSRKKVPLWLSMVLLELQSFPMIQRLRLKGDTPPNPEIQDLLARAFPNVTQFCLCDIRFPTRKIFEEFTNLVNRFPSLTALDIRGTGIYQPYRLTRRTLPPPSKLTALHLDYRHVLSVLSWINIHHSNERITDLSVDFGDENDVIVFRNFLGIRNDTLVRLSLEFVDAAWRTFAASVNLSYQTALRSLTMDLWDGDWRKENKKLDIPSYFSRTGDHRLRYIKFLLGHMPTTKWWTAMDDVLSGPRFSQLSHIVIVIPDRNTKIIPAMEALPKCAGRKEVKLMSLT
ncbi:hypothetical protein HGRIS_014618 [Hohenbuehelia grisea]|uniref:F-box domain-containing protein n=1 Tax=Hohenbuehelia grisea TaxID=104357 RepID=A0ABR3JUN1_9AGAR